MFVSPKSVWSEISFHLFHSLRHSALFPGKERLHFPLSIFPALPDRISAWSDTRQGTQCFVPSLLCRAWLYHGAPELSAELAETLGSAHITPKLQGQGGIPLHRDETKPGKFLCADMITVPKQKIEYVCPVCTGSCHPHSWLTLILLHVISLR